MHVPSLIPRGITRRSRRAPFLLAVTMVALAVLLPFVLSNFLLGEMALFLPYVILAIGVDVMWGENRIVSFGHGAFFAAGGYVGGLILKGAPGNVVGAQSSFLTQSSGKSFFQNLLSTLNSVQVHGIPLLALVCAPLVTGLAGLVIGAIMFRVASPQIYVPLVTLGIGVLAELAFNDVPALGGSNGLGGLPGWTDTLVNSGAANGVPMYVFNACFVGVVMLAYWLFRCSRAGLTWRALGDDPLRLEALGYQVRSRRAVGFAVSTALAGLGGALYAGTSNYIGPSLADVLFSTQALIWVAVGGAGTFMGPLLGVMTVNWGQYLLSSKLGFVQTWQLLLGLMLMAVVVIAPTGLAGIGVQRRLAWRRISGGRDAAASPAPATADEPIESKPVP